MKVTIAESSIAATDLMNALQSINRERERISENPAAVAKFEACKQLRRKLLRYVSVLHLVVLDHHADPRHVRSTTSNQSSGWAASSTPTTSWSRRL